MAESTVWWIITGCTVAVELLTGTFYLLMLAIGLASAAVAAHLGASSAAQIVVAALVGGSSVVGWHLRQKRKPSEPPAQANANVNLDIGEEVQVLAWNADGSADVHYRGARWTAIHRSGVTPLPGAHRHAAIGQPDPFARAQRFFRLLA